MIKVTCYGPRGSIPAPSTKRFSTIKYGGDTSCYFVEAGPHKIILDCGSGIRQLGNDMMAKGQGIGVTFRVLLSHYHWDHIQGLPFFVPVFIGANTFHFHGFVPSSHEHSVKPVVERMLQHQQSNPHFPVAHGALASQRFYEDHARQNPEKHIYRMVGNQSIEVLPGMAPEEDDLTIQTIPLNHPDGCLGYRLEYRGNSLVYASDNEPLRHPNFNLTKFGQGADLGIFDGQYTEKQLAGSVQTYGHGSAEACIDQALACNLRSLKIHHFDPNSSDEALDARLVEIREYALKVGYLGTVDMACQEDVWVCGVGYGGEVVRLC